MCILSNLQPKNAKISKENERKNKIFELPVIVAITRGLWKQLNYNSSSVIVEIESGDSKIG